MEKLIIVLVFFITVSGLFAQSDKWSYGLSIQGGASGEKDRYYNYRIDEQFGDHLYSNTSKRQPSVGVGIWLQYELANRWGIYTGFDYLQLSRFSRSENINYTTEKTIARYQFEEGGFHQHQLQLPLQIRFCFGQETKKWRPFLLGGVQAQYLLRHTGFYNSISGATGFFEDETETIETFDFRDVAFDFDYHRLQFGLVAGFGVELKRFLLSVQNSWAASSYQTAYTRLRCGFPLGTGGCFGPWITGVSTQLLRQSSLRVQYRL